VVADSLLVSALSYLRTLRALRALRALNDAAVLSVTAIAVIYNGEATFSGKEDAAWSLLSTHMLTGISRELPQFYCLFASLGNSYR
jgi:hypothetical protein